MNIFGQNPADITGAIFKSKNLSDIPDKAAARDNLNVPSKDDILYNALPIGIIVPYWGNTAPPGFLPCSGQTITSSAFPELVTFLGGTISAVIPDLRGEFLRGWDNGRGVDSGRDVGSVQLDAFQGHFHNTVNNVGTGGSSTVNVITAPSSSTGDLSTLSPLVGTTVGYPRSDGTNGTPRTAQETRPRNVAVLYCIKAYNSISNYTSGLNIAGLASDVSSLSSSAVRYSDWSNKLFSTNGYQKLVGGLVIQWVSVVMPTTQGGITSFTYPIAFDNAVLSVAFAPDYAVTTYGYNSMIVGNRTTTGGQLRNTGLSAVIGANAATTIIAIGY